MNHIPKGLSPLTTCITVRDAKKAIELYQKALNAKIQGILEDPVTGGVLHARIEISGMQLFLADEDPAKGLRAPKEGEVCSSGFYLYVENVQKAHQQALDAGFQEIMPVQDMFWGDRMGVSLDPFGYKWDLATCLKEISFEDVQATLLKLSN